MKHIPVEREAISRALTEQPNITKAARVLGASRRTLQSRMRDYGMAPGKAGRPRQLLPKGPGALPVALSATAGLVVGSVLGALALTVWWLRRKPVDGAIVTGRVRLSGLDLIGAG